MAVLTIGLSSLAGRHTVFEKHWREPIPRSVVDEFWAELQKQGGPNCAPPATSAGKFVMMHAARGQLLLVGALARDVPAYLVIELLDRVGGLLELYLKELNEDALRANFVTVYQLLDEIIDNGFPLHTEPNVLQELVMQPGKMESMMASVTGASHVRGALPESTSSIAPWRRSGVRYAANELYLDLVERLDATVRSRTDRHTLCPSVGNSSTASVPLVWLSVAAPFPWLSVRTRDACAACAACATFATAFATA